MEKKNVNHKTNVNIPKNKPASMLTNNEKKKIKQRMAEIRKYNKDPGTTQNTIPYIQMFKDGICQVTSNFYSKTVQFYDVNYQLAEFDEQDNIFSKYCELLNFFDNTVKFQLTFENQNRSQEKLLKEIEIPLQEDDFNDILI